MFTAAAIFLITERTQFFLEQKTLASAAGFTGTVALISNLVSNVPAVMLYVPLIGARAGSDNLWLLLAMASTLAGNLTIVGSVANLIVLEATKDQVQISFLEYFKVGMPLTLLTLAAGVILLAA